MPPRRGSATGRTDAATGPYSLRLLKMLFETFGVRMGDKAAGTSFATQMHGWLKTNLGSDLEDKLLAGLEVLVPVFVNAGFLADLFAKIFRVDADIGEELLKEGTDSLFLTYFREARNLKDSPVAEQETILKRHADGILTKVEERVKALPPHTLYEAIARLSEPETNAARLRRLIRLSAHADEIREKARTKRIDMAEVKFIFGTPEDLEALHALEIALGIGKKSAGQDLADVVKTLGSRLMKQLLDPKTKEETRRKLHRGIEGQRDRREATRRLFGK